MLGRLILVNPSLKEVSKPDAGYTWPESQGSKPDTDATDSLYWAKLLT